MDMADDEPLYTTREERQVWSQLACMVVSAAAYTAWVLPEVARHPVAGIHWVVPLFWATLAGLVCTVVVAVVLEIVVVVRRGAEAKSAVTVDVRDREIGRRGVRLATPVMGTGLAAVLVLAARGADDFWIGNVAFLTGLVAAVAESILKIRLYRRGF
ncbi:hypothetical protein ACWT_2671 [Actinoplanes sp. SE50]|uniref:hypothetical protein n=1 Tax=unclassified Actinoplanes TaxID=2626549 RepID=UPI00023ECC86|nr:MULTISPECIES: hypothetical protein [unclassified Actinoplanes]AEV83770.1 hypothetical protein ACPL_2875 [Actinoplanes sp. SE50/110]ATO82086.1 hypothetical protein ACWT_2671 [Actinoplanes sp. SE50]SLL99493.1 hypothetical protein ACSP50_2724 [Actinoplanes sp. SE50/110]